MTDLKKNLTGILLLCAGTLAACGPYFPPTFIDEEEAEVIGVSEKELVYHLSLLAEHFMPDVIPPSPRSDEPDPKEPRKEYELYQKGIREITENPRECFPAAWKTLLQLPPAERRYRTVRTLYMLGNLALRNREDDAAAWKFYQELRKAVLEESFPDNLGLTRDTFNALRRYSSPLGKLRYLPLAARFRASRVSFRMELEEIVKHLSAAERSRALQDPYLAELLLLADPGNIRKSGHRFLLADRLAMRAYQKGNFPLCENLLQQAPDHSLIKLFLQARFARGRGDKEKAVQLLREWVKQADFLLQTSPEYRFRREYYASQDFSWKQEVHGQIGLLTLEERDYQEALLCFLNAGSWSDAAIIAERYMSLDALKKFADAHCTDFWSEAETRRIWLRLRHLLARAMLRHGNIEEAIPYFPQEFQDIMQNYLQQTLLANAPDCDAEKRAKALFRLGQLQLLHNIGLLGYELEPDFYICDGQYAVWPPEKLRKKSKFLRFHYRRTIAETFQKAAGLTHDPELKFASLLAAGWTLRDRTPKSADLYYKELCRMKFEPGSGILIRRKWFPCPLAGWRESFSRIDPDGKSLHEYLAARMAEWQDELPLEKGNTEGETGSPRAPKS